MPLTPGARLGVFEVLGSLGAGGMGEVYRARDARLQRDVAIKILPEAVASDTDRLSRFEREAQLLASLHHPHIASIFGIEESGGHHALVLELIEGETIAERLRRGRVAVPESLSIAWQIALALEAAHDRGIIHRDLKPANVKLTPDGTVKVLDFGLAKALTPTATGSAGDDPLLDSPTVSIAGTQVGMLLGTAAYMSPEQARGQALDARTDIWSFGCVLYEMLTGRMAFDGPTVTDILSTIVSRDPDWDALPPETPPHVRQLLRRLLAKDLKRRLRHIGDARLEVEESSSLTAGEDRPAAARRRSPWLLAAIAAGAGLLLSTGALMMARLVTRSTADGAPRIVRTMLVTNTPAQEFGPAISPDGKWIAYYSDVSGRSDVWVRFLDSGTMLNLTASLNLEMPVRAALGGVDVSPDGAAITFSARTPGAASTQFDTWVIPAPAGGVARKIIQGVQAMRFSPDGKRLAGMRPGATAGDALWVVNVDGSNPREIMPVAGGRHAHWPTWSRDGRYIYYIGTYITWHDEPSEVWRVPVDGGGAPMPVVRSGRRAIHPAPMPAGQGLVFSANPSTVDLGLWWQPDGSAAPVSLSAGVGEHTEPYASADGRRIVATLLQMRQSLVRIPVRFDRPSVEEPITDGYSGDLHPAFDATGRLFFSSSRSGYRNLWRARGDGGQATPVTSETALDERPALSANGDRIAFVSDRGGRPGIWIVNVDGGTPRFVGAADVLDSLAWSPDGTRILFATTGSSLPRLAAMLVADGTVETFPIPAAGHSPSWSAATGQIAYLQPTEPTPTAQSRTYVAIVDGQGRRLHPDLPSQQAFQNGFVAWSPDGRRLAALAIAANTAAEIWILEPGAAQPFRRLMTMPVTVRLRGVTWTPDGSALVIAKQIAPSDIVLFELATPP